MKLIPVGLTLVALLLMPGCGSGEGTGTYTPPVNPEVQSLATTVCSKMVSCGLPGTDQADCVKTVVGAVPFVVGPSQVASCITSLPCNDLMCNSNNAITRCLDINYNSFSCAGTSMQYCTNSGQCSSIACSSFCSFLGGTFVTCATNSSGVGGCQCQIND